MTLALIHPSEISFSSLYLQQYHLRCWFSIGLLTTLKLLFSAVFQWGILHFKVMHLISLGNCSTSYFSECYHINLQCSVSVLFCRVRQVQTRVNLENSPIMLLIKIQNKNGPNRPHVALLWHYVITQNPLFQVRWLSLHCMTCLRFNKVSLKSNILLPSAFCRAATPPKDKTKAIW